MPQREGIRAHLLPPGDEQNALAGPLPPPDPPPEPHNTSQLTAGGAEVLENGWQSQDRLLLRSEVVCETMGTKFSRGEVFQGGMNGPSPKEGGVCRHAGGRTTSAGGAERGRNAPRARQPSPTPAGHPPPPPRRSSRSAPASDPPQSPAAPGSSLPQRACHGVARIERPPGAPRKDSAAMTRGTFTTYRDGSPLAPIFSHQVATLLKPRVLVLGRLELCCRDEGSGQETGREGTKRDRRDGRNSREWKWTGWFPRRVGKGWKKPGGSSSEGDRKQRGDGDGRGRSLGKRRHTVRVRRSPCLPFHRPPMIPQGGRRHRNGSLLSAPS